MSISSSGTSASVLFVYIICCVFIKLKLARAKAPALNDYGMHETPANSLVAFVCSDDVIMSRRSHLSLCLKWSAL